MSRVWWTRMPTSSSVRDEIERSEIEAIGQEEVDHRVEVGKMLAEAMQKRYEERTGSSTKVRHKQIGYETRCSEPSAFDVLLGTQLGTGAYRALVEEELSGHMVSVEKQLQLKYVPFGDLIDPETLKTRVRFIERDSDFYKLARALEYQQLQGPEC